MSFDEILRARKGAALAQAQRLGPAFYQNGDGRIPAREFKRTPVGNAKEMGMFPKRYSECLEYNQKIKICCRHMENVTGRLYKTHPDLNGPDLFIATCGVCGCNHYRLAVGEQ
ncbi:MAG: hypothetical protein ACR2RF_25055 [Geminicoccaceae bacterium]